MLDRDQRAEHEASRFDFFEGEANGSPLRLAPERELLPRYKPVSTTGPLESVGWIMADP